MQYKYTIVQENVNDKNKVTFEFTSVDEDEFVDNISSFMNMVGWNEGGRLEMVNTSSLYDDIDSEVQDSFDFGKPEINPELESFKNFEFPIGNNKDYEMYGEGKGQMDYTFTSSDMDSIVDRPSQPTYRVDSIYTTNGDEPTYYGD